MSPVEALDWQMKLEARLGQLLNNGKLSSTTLFKVYEHSDSRCVPSFSGSGYMQVAPKPRFKHDYRQSACSVLYYFRKARVELPDKVEPVGCE